MYIFEVFSNTTINPGQKIIIIFAYCLALLTAFVLHEFAHSWVAVKMGDDTPKYNGRLTINPVAHIDPLGFAMLFFLGFGWAKPVPINPANFKNRKKGMIWVSLAGVLANFVVAMISYVLFVLLSVLCARVPAMYDVLGGLVVIFFAEYFSWTCMICLFLFAFNILPLYPLDGSKLLETVLDGRGGKFTYFLKRYSNYILIGLIVLGVVADRIGFPQIDLLSNYVTFVSNLIYNLFDMIGSLFL